MTRRLVLVLLAAAACRAGGPNGPRVRVTIPEGASLSAAADSLAAHHVIGSAAAFKFYARLLGESDEIKAGTYDLVPNLPVLHVLHVVTSGREALRRLSVPEGLMLSEVAQEAQAQLGIPADSFLAAARDSALAAAVGAPTPSLEGYLYPSTYLVRFGVTAPEVVKMMVEEFQARWQPEWNARLGPLHMTRHQVVTLASIIEGEVRFGPDRPYVSSVYHNRLDRRMRLQADPTVIYALGHRRRLYEKDYAFRSRYNTYLIDGLPPTPINQPSAASIEAALYPAHTNLLYLVARPDGKHIFSRTLREHLQAVAQVRRMADAPPKAQGAAKGKIVKREK